MLDLGKHAIFIWASYGVVFASLIGLVVWLMWDGKRQQSLLDMLEAQGVRRRSARDDNDT